MEPALRPVTAAAIPSGQWSSWNRQKWIFAFLAGIYVAARLYHLAAVCLDGDEIFSVGISMKSWGALTAAAGQDSIHPPLFYYLLKLWITIGNDSLLWVRLLPALFSTISIAAILLLGREFRLRPAEINGALGLAAIHPFLIYYSQHVRMYSLLMLCALVSLWLFHRSLRSGPGAATRWAMLTLANIALVYSHYYGWLIVGLECGYLLFWKREHLKRAAVSVAATAAAFGPWLYVAAKYAVAKGGLASNLEWIQKPTVDDLIWFFVDLAGYGDMAPLSRHLVASIALLIAVATWVAWRERRRLHRGHLAYLIRYLAFFLLGAVATTFFASRWMRSSVWGHRHLIFVAVPFLMMIVCAYSRMRSRAVRLSGALLCAAWACLAIQHHVQGNEMKSPFDTLVTQMLASERTTSGAIPFFSVDKYLHYPIWFYLETLKAKRQTGFAAPIDVADRDALAAEAGRFKVMSNVALKDARGEHFWVGYTSAWREQPMPEALLIERGCRVGDDVQVRDRFHTSTIFPVWCDQ